MGRWTSNTIVFDYCTSRTCLYNTWLLSHGCMISMVLAASPSLRLRAIDMIFSGSHATEVFSARRHSKRVKRIVIGTKKKTKPLSYRTLLLSRLRMRFSHRHFSSRAHARVCMHEGRVQFKWNYTENESSYSSGRARFPCSNAKRYYCYYRARPKSVRCSALTCANLTPMVELQQV